MSSDPFACEDPFEHKSPTDNQVAAMNGVRSGFRELKSLIETSCPPSARRTLAIRELEIACMWANKSILFGK